MTDTNKLDLILHNLQTLQASQELTNTRIDGLQKTLDQHSEQLGGMQNTLDQHSTQIASIQGTLDQHGTQITNLQSSFAQHRLHVDGQFQLLEERLDMRFTDVENQIGSLRDSMIERFHSLYDHVDGQAKMTNQTFDFVVKRFTWQFEDTKRHFDTKFNQVHERFVEVQEDLDTIRQQTARNTEMIHSPRRPSNR